MRLAPRRLALLVTCAFWSGGPALGQAVLDPALRIDVYASGFTSPSFFVFLPGSPGGDVDFLICEIGHGTVLHYRNGVYLSTALDLDVASLFERGLFGIALHPDFEHDPYVYLYYTKSRIAADSGNIGDALENRVSRFTWDGSTLSNEQVLLSLPVGPNHNGGVLLFGPDGMLYGSIGEAGSTGGQLQNVPTGPPPNETSMIFRLQDDGTPPADNPFYALGGPMQVVYAYGLRNCFGMDFDPATNVLWCTDNGPTDYDEIDRVVPGMNGGWKQIMGPDSRSPQGVGDLWMAPGAAYVDPKFSFLQSFGITAIQFPRGAGLGPNYAGDCFVAAHNSQTVYRFHVTPDRTGLVMPDSTLADLVADTSAERDRFLWAPDVGVITDMDTGPDGALYILCYSGNARLYRIWRPPTSGAGPVSAAGARFDVAPNPFRLRTTVRVRGAAGPGGTGHGVAPDPEQTVRIFSPAGRLVRVLPARATGAEWDGRDEAGLPVVAGLYLVRLAPRGGSAAVEAKVVRIR